MLSPEASGATGHRLTVDNGHPQPPYHQETIFGSDSSQSGYSALEALESLEHFEQLNNMRISPPCLRSGTPFSGIRKA